MQAFLMTLGIRPNGEVLGLYYLGFYTDGMVIYLC